MSKFTNAVTSIFKPKIAEPATGAMPDPGGFASKLKARKEQRKKKKQGGGRESTIKSNTYSGSNLGGTA